MERGRGSAKGKRLPHYINDPVVNRLTAPENKLYRPHINFGKAVAILLGELTGMAACSFVVAMWFRHKAVFGMQEKSILWIFAVVYGIVQFFVFAVALKYILIWLVRVYQRYAKAETRLKCCFTPSCSEYAILAIKKYGALVGVIKTANRLFRCHPPGGIDYP